MCTKADAKMIAKATLPPITKIIVTLFAGSMLGLLSWGLVEIHGQDARFAKISGQHINSTTELTGSINLLNHNLEELGKISATERAARGKLVDERCETMNQRITTLTDRIKILESYLRYGVSNGPG